MAKLKNVKKCPKCGGKTGVVDVHIRDIGVVRRRSCTLCGCRYNTVEILQEDVKFVNGILKTAEKLLER